MFQNATLFRIIRKKDNAYSLKPIITSNTGYNHNVLHHSKHNCSSTLIQYNNTPVETFNPDGTITSCTEHPKEIHTSTISKNGQLIASISEPFYDGEEQILTIQNLLNNHTSSTKVAIDAIGHPLEKLHSHPNNTLIIGDSLWKTTIYTIHNDALVTVPKAPDSNSYFNRDETILCNSEKYYEIYSPEDLKNLDNTINLLQYFALKRIDDKKRDANGIYSVPQTSFNTLCWKSFTPEQIKLLSETLNLDISALTTIINFIH